MFLPFNVFTLQFLIWVALKIYYKEITKFILWSFHTNESCRWWHLDDIHMIGLSIYTNFFVNYIFEDFIFMIMLPIIKCNKELNHFPIPLIFKYFFEFFTASNPKVLFLV